MATISFAGLDQDFFISDNLSVEFSAYDGTLYSYLTTGGHDWALSGTALSQTLGVLDGGTVKAATLDLDSDFAPEIAIAGISAGAASLSIGTGTSDEQRDRFWAAVLGGDDVLDFVMADYGVSLAFNGDGATVSDGGLHQGGDDRFRDAGTALFGFSWLTGDYSLIASGSARGGNDRFGAGAFALQGDFATISEGASGVGGDDVIAPAHLVEFPTGYFLAEGDAETVYGDLTGGDDYIDLRGTSVPFLFSTLLLGDAYFIGSTGVAVGGDDTIHGSVGADIIYGDWAQNAGAETAGRNRLWGHAGDDSIFGGNRADYISGDSGDDFLEGRGGNDAVVGGDGADTIFGGDADDSLDGGFGGDVLDGGRQHDSLRGAGGDDTLFGYVGNDTLDGGAGRDYLDGGDEPDQLLGGHGADTLEGRNGDDWMHGGNSADTLVGRAGDDTLLGGDGPDYILGGDGFDSIVGGNGADYLIGNLGADTLGGGAGTDILAGRAGADEFQYAVNGERDTIEDFQPGDAIRIIGFGTSIDTFAELIARATSSGGDTTISFGGGDFLVLKGVLVSELTASDFTFG